MIGISGNTNRKCDDTLLQFISVTVCIYWAGIGLVGLQRSPYFASVTASSLGPQMLLADPWGPAFALRKFMHYAKSVRLDRQLLIEVSVRFGR